MKRKDFGKFEISSPDAPTIEIDVVPCGHCGFLTPNVAHCKEAQKKAVTHLEGLFWQQQGKMITYHCSRCNRQVCGKCSAECVPAEARLEVAEGTRNSTAVSVGVILPEGAD